MLELEVIDITPIAEGVMQFDLAACAGELPPFEAGAHIDVELPMPDGSLQLRQYSLVNPIEPAGRYRIAVLREESGRGGSRHLHDRIVPGHKLRGSPPRNHFRLHEGPGKPLLVAGGIGVTPILAMARSLTARGVDFELHYVARSSERMAYQAEIAEICGERAHFFFDGGDPARRLDIGAIISAQPRGCHLYVCGPAGLIAACRETAAAAGWPETHIHSEAFAAPVVTASGRFRVVARTSGVTVEVGETETVLDALLRAGIDADYDCRRGECGACCVPVLSGAIKHKDYYLSARERASNTVMCTCVSRAAGEEIELDI